MLGRNVNAGMLFLAVVVLVVEGFLVYRWYDHYAASDTASGDATGGASASGKTTAAGGVPPNDADEGSFVHTADDGNSRGDYTYLSDSRIDGDAVVLAAPASDRGNDVGRTHGHNIGVWYEPGEKRWAIFNQDRTARSAPGAWGARRPALRGRARPRRCGR